MSSFAMLSTTLWSVQLTRLCYLYTVAFILYLRCQLPSFWSCCLDFSCFYCLRISSAITKYTTIFKRKILKYCLEILRHPGTQSQKDWQLKKQRTKNNCQWARGPLTSTDVRKMWGSIRTQHILLHLQL